MTILRLSLHFCIVLSVVSGCTTTTPQITIPDRQLAVRQAFVSHHEQRAHRYEADDALNLALKEWRLINVVTFESTTTRAKIDSLVIKIDKRFRQFLNIAEEATRNNKIKAARLALLKALALKPDHGEAIEKLRVIVGKHAYGRLTAQPAEAKKNSRDIGTYPEERADLDPDLAVAPSKIAKSGSESRSINRSVTVSSEPIGQGLAHMARNEYGTALRIFEDARDSAAAQDDQLDNYIAEAIKALAEQHYEKGVSAFRAAQYAEALKHFEHAMRYAPGHRKALYYHSTAETLQAK